MRSRAGSTILSLVLLVLSSLSMATAARADAPGLPPGPIYYKLRMTFVLERQKTYKHEVLGFSIHHESKGWAIASKVGVYVGDAGPRPLVFQAFLVAGAYTGHTGSGHMNIFHQVKGQYRPCQADYKDRFKRSTSLVGPSLQELPFVAADGARFRVGWHDLDPDLGRPTVSTKFSDVRCQFGKQWRRVPTFTEPCLADCFVTPVSAPYSIPVNGFGRDIIRSIRRGWSTKRQ